jgi:hypothetical protein
VSTAGPTEPNGRGSTRSIGRTGSNIRSAGSNGRDWDRDGIGIEGEILSETTRENGVITTPRRFAMPALDDSQDSVCQLRAYTPRITLR